MAVAIFASWNGGVSGFLEIETKAYTDTRDANPNEAETFLHL